MSEFLLGSSYYPEWWKESEWDEDFKKMEEMGFNAVRMGEFAWSFFEPREGEYNFEPMRRAIDCAERHGIKVILGTVSAVCPAWLYKKYPEVKGGNDKGHYNFGGRKGQCLSSDIFLEYAFKITEEEAKALGSHKNVVGWQLDNEPGFPFYDFDENCNKGFREFLKNKYGTIEKLNDAWFTQMWSNVYNDFSEIEIPVNACEGGMTPEIQLDYRKYFSFTFNRLLSGEAKILRKYSPGRFLYTNWPGANWSVNCFEGSKYLDFAAWDNYVGQPHGENYRIQLRASMEHSFDRYLGKEQNKFLVAEQKAFVDANSPAEIIRAQTWLNISHGAFGTVFFEWRTPIGGTEQEYGSVLGRDKRPRAETEQIYKKLASEIKDYYSLIDGAKTNSEAAVIYSYENSWGSLGWVVDGPYDEEFFNAYGGFKNSLKTNVDVISIDADFSKYKLLVLPNYRITSEEDVKKFKSFAENGGTLVLNTQCGTRDEFNRMRELLEPGLFKEMAGAFVTSEITAAELKNQTGEEPVLKYADNSQATLSGLVQKLSLTEAKALAVYKTGALKDCPAVTKNNVGKGCVILYAQSGNDVCFYEELANAVKNETDIKPLIDVSDDAIVSSRTKGDKDYIFAVNMKDTPVFANLKGDYKDVLHGKTVSGKVEIEAYDALFITKE